MKASIKLATLACALSGVSAAPEKAEKRAGCNADNCLRAIAITRLGEATRQVRLYDCSSFLQATVTPAATTIVTTSTVMTTVTSGAASIVPNKREDAPLAPRSASSEKPIPAYASPCSGSVRYSSACLCAGATISTETAEVETLTSTVYSTSTIVISDSPAYQPTKAVHVPKFDDWTSTYTYDEVALPTFAAQSDPTFSAPVPTSTCLFDPTVPGNEFYIMDQYSGYMVNRDGAPGPPAPPTTQEEADAKADPSTFNPPTYVFEKPENGPDRMYDIVLAGSNPKLYIAMKTNGDMTFTTGSTQGVVKNRLITTIFNVDCFGMLTVTQGTTTYIWKATDKGTNATPGAPNNEGIVILPKSMRNPIPPRPSKRDLEERTYAEEGFSPRCFGAPSNVFAVTKVDARKPAANGCGSGALGKLVPNWNFGSCCDAHDYCFDNCDRAFEGCNLDFLGCMSKKCWSVAKSWTFWLAPACFGMADLYAGIVSGPLGMVAFQSANSDRCTCTCPSSNGQKASICGPNCIVTGGNDNNNCGGCGNTCPFKTHCSNGGCTCDGDRCGNLCLNLQTHPRNCGSCGNVCASGYCWQGTCMPVPANPDHCIPVDGFDNGGFAYNSDQGWTVTRTGDALSMQPALGVFDGAASGSDPFDAAVDILHGPTGGSVTLSQAVHICPGTSYALDFVARRVYGTTNPQRSCTIQASLGGRQVLSPTGIEPTLTTWKTFGPLPVSAFGAGDGALTPASKHYYTTQFAVTVTCNGNGGGGSDTFRLDSFSIYPQ
ncbi:uncharacterized protein E0L32_007002 [Thyridium curvatum]|uniref:Uncharacterized protein n=1 Tax=Thyridium curvatum TaxID=1093900 RepID=A0A507ANI3_9PEZI|nr:uncharacterized protein E0L32_007002 [Thyridium curvatum]TPX12355.1 hypothetical protein E0L32_007002 [Thyridium curvatum]